MSWKKIACIFFSLAISVLASQPVFADKNTELEIGYMPILPVSQLFVKLGEGSFEKAHIKPKLIKFQNGPAMAQALLAGQLDVAYIGIGPAMVAKAKGATIKVVASNIVEQISFIALKDLAPYFKNGPAKTAFSRFAKDKGRKPAIATFPKGSVPYTVFQYWLRKQLGANPDDVKIIAQGAALVKQSLVTGAVDGAAILEPIVSAVTAKVKDAQVVTRGSAMFPDQPGAVLAVREKLIKEKPKLVAALVAAHQSATKMLNAEPMKAAIHVKKYVGGGRLPQKIVNSSVKNSVGNFVSDPSKIIGGSTKLRDFQKDLGTLKVNVDLEDLFELSFYNALK